MNRRTVLAGVGTALGLSGSGCLGEATDASETDPAITLSLASVDDDIDPLSFEIGLADEVDAALLDEEGCARLERRIARDDVEVETVLEPGDAIEQRYAIAPVDEELTDSCPDPGTYRAAHEYGEHGTWGFELELR
ncbi:hypothetical protein [Natronococcus roseus]|uniref:hypothetical protein n=1 Tax=Natronococcus roseus TaxID=1052014 RepID=UPI00374D2380